MKKVAVKVRTDEEIRTDLLRDTTKRYCEMDSDGHFTCDYEEIRCDGCRVRYLLSEGYQKKADTVAELLFCMKLNDLPEIEAIESVLSDYLDGCYDIEIAQEARK